MYLNHRKINLPIIIAGDLNSPSNKKDVVLEYLKSCEYESSFHILNKNVTKFVSHVDHNGSLVGADYIFVRCTNGELKPIESILHPKNTGIN